MSYISDNLMSGEHIVAQAYTHFMIYLLPCLFLIFAFLLLFMGDKGMGDIAFVIFVIFLIRSAIIDITSEFAVTNNRVIAKRGFIMRDTVEINLPKVEGIRINQSILGRMFGYGDVIISGTGGIQADFKFIADPLWMRNYLVNYIEEE